MNPPTSKTRTEPCTAGQARKRLADAIKFLEVAELVDDEPIHVSTGVSASLAVLAGIAAADAACCAAHGRRSRGDRHEDAAKLISRVQPGGKTAAVTFGRLLRVKDDAQYGLMSVRPPARDTALRHARKLVDFAARIVEATR